MEWQPNEQDAWLGDAERWISQIHGVKHCKIDLDRSGEITGVHVVAGMEREPRHIVRDVEGLLKARLGVSVFYKKIGVVQVVDGDEDEADVEAPGTEVADSGPEESFARFGREPDRTDDEAMVLEEVVSPRVQCLGVGVLTSPLKIKAEVELQAGGLTARGEIEGANHSDGDVPLVARATLSALAELVADPVVLEVAEVKMAALGGQTVVLVAVELIEGRRCEVLFGACAAHQNRHQAVVYAILDALNRRLALMAFRSEETAG